MMMVVGCSLTLFWLLRCAADRHWKRSVAWIGCKGWSKKAAEWSVITLAVCLASSIMLRIPKYAFGHGPFRSRRLKPPPAAFCPLWI